MAEQLFGSDWEAKILAQRVDIITEFEAEYNSYNDTLENIVKVQIESMENQKNSLEQHQKDTDAIYDQQVADLEELKTQWENITAQYEIKQAELLVNEHFGADEERGILDLRLLKVQQFVADYLAAMAQLNGINGNNVPAYSEGTPGFKPNIPAYASGTRGAKRGLAITDENHRFEIKGRDIMGGKYTLLDEGEPVFPHNISKNLWEMGANPMRFMEQNMKGILEIAMPKFAPITKTTSTVDDHSTSFGNITVNSGAKTFNQLLRDCKVKSRNR